MAMAVSLEGREGKCTNDGAVDLKGRPILPSKRGGWAACSFLIAYGLLERLAYYAISSNLVSNLTHELQQGTVSSANNVNYWVGTAWLTPILGAYIADAFLGQYWTCIIASIIYLFGMCLLILAVSLPSLKPPSCGTDTNDPNCTKKATSLQLGIFFFALYTLAVGIGGTKPNISTIGADQFDESDPGEHVHKLSFFNWWMFSICFGTLFANTMLVYIQDNVGWTLGYALPTLGFMISVVIFVLGTPLYRRKLPSGSPFTRMARVLVAATRKWRVAVPSDPKELHELDLVEWANKSKFRIDSTPSLRFLNKAAVKTGPTSPWMLTSVTQVEETKQMLKMIPILIATFIPSTMSAQINTFFVKQGITLNRHMGPHFQIPPASLVSFVTISMLICVVIYDRYFVPIMKKWTKNPRGITLLQRMGVGLVLHIIIMVIASPMEHWQLSTAREYGVVENGGKVPLTVFILLPQFALMGVADAFLEVAKIEFFNDQAPEGMKSLGTSLAMASSGIGNFLSSFLLSTVAHITKKPGHKGWIVDNLNASHLDYYYAFFAVLNFINFIFFLIMCKYYVYKPEISESIGTMDPLGEVKEMPIL